ncbi:DUF1523 family protein [Flavimaricola marinus]|uniref:DUF1523 domain-containing protein n=1 Tax=Flavimaricola marinus TaxID=1819565 RepID=A0A238L9A4_9RHOB|nr:DUF1523 family protein [Flavimaricola marinus]SMY06153.1 hypothetical protein LOM8899_00275 [Flavimaricola marinus]
MGSYIKWTFWIVVWAVVAAFFSYVLPQRDIVRVTGTEIIRTDFTNLNRIFYAQADSGAAEQPTRDLRLINTVRYEKGVMVYRNEDTGWIWPPYFKFDSSDLQAEAQDLISSSTDPQWAVVLHYGWRIRYLTIYPNAITIRPIDDPTVRLIPWVNIVILLFFAALVWGVTVRLRRFKARRIDPRLQRLDDAVDERRAGISRWFASWRR